MLTLLTPMPPDRPCSQTSLPLLLIKLLIRKILSLLLIKMPYALALLIVIVLLGRVLAELEVKTMPLAVLPEVITLLLEILLKLAFTFKQISVELTLLVKVYISFSVFKIPQLPMGGSTT